MSTDPAHSLADMLETKDHPGPHRLKGVKGKLTIWQIDSASEFQKFLASNREGHPQDRRERDVLQPGRDCAASGYDAAGHVRDCGLLGLRGLLENGEHDHIVADTAPFGHTLRLFELPGHFQRFLNFLEVAFSRDALLAQRFGGRTAGRSNGFLEEWQLTVQRVKEAFSAEQAEVLPVTSPESFSLNESVRCLEALQESAPEMRLAVLF